MRSLLLPTSNPAVVPDRDEISRPPAGDAADARRTAALEAFAIGDERGDPSPEATHPRRISGIGYIVGG